ncbi:MAG: hypothetical protein BWX50_00804 [Euryarchaeota archaeon ADurb.Bin009]|nr:MAG: hypothetical protein BWX50_00804 [Euryarchaeota archaeon ADurb.Bin009]
MRDHVVLPGGLEEVAEALLFCEVLLDRFAPHLLYLLHLAVDYLVVHPEAGIDGEFTHRERLAGLKTPPRAAGGMHLDVAGAGGVDRAFDLLHEVGRVGDRGGRDVGRTVGGKDRGHILLREQVSRRARARRARRGARAVGRRTRPLDPGVHVGLVVVADVGDVVAPLEGAADAEHPDIERGSVAGDADNLFAAPLLLQRRLDARRNRRNVLEERVDPGNLPGGLGVGCGEDFHASRRGGDDDVLPGRLEEEPGRKRRSAPSARPVPGREEFASLLFFSHSEHLRP